MSKDIDEFAEDLWLEVVLLESYKLLGYHRDFFWVDEAPRRYPW